MGPFEDLPGERLRGLDGPQRVRGPAWPPPPRASTVLTVSATGRPGTTAGRPERTASMTASKSSGGARARAASWTSTTSSADHSTPSPAATEAERSEPPATTSTTPGRAEAAAIERASSRWEAGATTTTWSTARTASARPRACPSSGSPFSETNALGSEPRAERPALLRRGRQRRSGGEDLVEHGLGLVLVGLLQRARARRRGSGGPWRACASHLRKDRGPCPGATGRGRPRPP